MVFLRVFYPVISYEALALGGREEGVGGPGPGGHTDPLFVYTRRL